MKYVRIIIALCLVMGLATEISGQRPTEYEVKAAFLYNFARFVTWPEEAFEQPDSPMVIGVYGDNPFGGLLERTVRNETVQMRGFVVRNLRQLEDIRTCHILFIPASEMRNHAQIQNAASTTPVLTVGEQPGFCEAGGMINFFLQQNRVRFEINPDAAERAGLEISSRLLKLAKIVKESPREAP